jgi:hypothetical protein
MSLWSRIWNVVRGDRLNSDIDAEFESHIQEAIVDGRDPDEARRAFGPRLLMRENVRDQTSSWSSRAILVRSSSCVRDASYSIRVKGLRPFRSKLRR